MSTGNYNSNYIDINEYNQNINIGISPDYYKPDYNITKNMSIQEYNYYVNNPPPKINNTNSYIGDVIFGRRLMDTSEIDNKKYANSNLFRSSSADISSSRGQGLQGVGSHWQH